MGHIAPNRKLTTEQVIETLNNKKEYKTGLNTQKWLGKRYGISQATVHDIVNSLTYPEV